MKYNVSSKRKDSKRNYKRDENMWFITDQNNMIDDAVLK